LSDTALLVLQLELVLSDVIFGQGRAFGYESVHLTPQTLQFLGSLMVAVSVGLLYLVQDAVFELMDLGRQMSGIDRTFAALEDL
jgi:predicted Co/Zn/Cd cation transporter (cation efflux family)